MTISATSQGLKPGVCTSSNRPANPFDGMMIYETDTDKVAVYDVNAWVYKTAASVPVASGLVFISSTAFTTAASVSLPVATFSATYQNYLVHFTLSAASTTLNISGRLRIAGADNTTSNYSTMLTGFQGDNTAANVGNTGQTSFSLKSVGSDCKYGASFTFFDPFVADQTNIVSQIASINPGVAVVGSSGAHMFDAATSFDSFSFIASTGTISGTVKVYGYANS